MHLLLECRLLKNAHSQKTVNTDIEDIFKMWMYLDNQSHSFLVDDTSVFNKNNTTLLRFLNAVEWKIDTLENLSLLSQKNLTYIFYSTNLDEQKILDSKPKEILEIPWKKNGSATILIIAINPYTGRSYRIQGFRTSDCLSFIDDFIYSGEVKTLKDFLKIYKVEGINFKCLSDGLRKSGRNLVKYPCLNNYADHKEINHGW